MEDLLECIFGDIPSPSDATEEARMTPLDDHRWSVDGGMPLDDFARGVGAQFEDVGVETIGGLVLHEIGELPAESTAIDIGEFRFTVAAVENNRISRLVVERTEMPPEPSAEGEPAEPRIDNPTDTSVDAPRREEG
jgi:putative hemolysin